MMRIIYTKVSSKLWSVVRMRAEVKQKCSFMVRTMGRDEVRRHAPMMGVHIARLVADVCARVGKAQVMESARSDRVPAHMICMPLVRVLKTDQICLYA